VWQYSCTCSGRTARSERSRAAGNRAGRRWDAAFSRLQPRAQSLLRRRAARRGGEDRGRRRPRKAPPKPDAQECDRRSATARPLGRRRADCVFGAHARAALSGRIGRARLDSKHRFTGGAAFGASYAWAQNNPLRRPSVTLEGAAARAATALAPGRRDEHGRHRRARAAPARPRARALPGRSQHAHALKAALRAVPKTSDL
jgi:hypothetical protein